jgi:hypothetical protein
MTWFKSSHSGTEGDNCIEIAVTQPTVHIRDSKDPTRTHLTTHHTSWSDFIRYAVDHR